ncbi:flagellar hook-associated protein FlgK [Brevibacillus laterosporus]|uniref:flagellar hook-associated protein FlgK n=1 Tax=Brevibacillus laterosporus TaxID=1465 RepID=UPI00144395D8|nr:flagellar hook-associated protein FlgK [Brevibacillus laterosporus]NKQ20377.1 flagellar hook-associated protein FlgK [Brevibacillus laterosporus]WNX30991.1 flagellar hook-associated protein FlgK [Brevibacillus laterosporus]
MRSTFHLIEVSKRALFAQQAALNVTGHNVANTNTVGYTRQRVNMAATTPIPGPGMNADRAPGLLGTGVYATDIQRIREDYIDGQYRAAAKNTGYWNDKVKTINNIEDIMNEPSDSSLQKVMDQMWKGWEDLSGDPRNQSVRSVLRERAVAVADTFNHMYNRLTQLQADLNNEVAVQAESIDSIAKQIASINKQIGDVVPHGYQPNDLYDQRDVLIDKLSSMVDVKVTPTERGMVNVSIGGQPLVTNATSVEMKATKNAETGKFDITLGGAEFKPLTASGTLSAAIEGRDETTTNMIQKINALAVNLAREINEVHRTGYNLDDIKNGTQEGLNFFVIDGGKDNPTSAGNIKVNPEILKSLDKIAAARADGTGQVNDGNNQNALEITKIKNKLIPAGTGDNPTDFPQSTTIDDFYRHTIAQLGVDGQEAYRNYKNADTTSDMILMNRESVSGVDTDEEMTNVIKFQKAYSAAARVMTSMDEILDKIINGMGRVGL